jgi:signal transduction histidine kinase
MTKIWNYEGSMKEMSTPKPIKKFSNALKYSNENSNLKSNINHFKEKIECCIADSSIGVPAEDLEKIFNQFYCSKSERHIEIKETDSNYPA